METVESTILNDKTTFSSIVWVEILDKKYFRKIVFNQLFKGENKEEIKKAVQDWTELSKEEKNKWVVEVIGQATNLDSFVDLINILNYEKNPKTALKIWNEMQKNGKE